MNDAKCYVGVDLGNGHDFSVDCIMGLVSERPGDDMVSRVLYMRRLQVGCPSASEEPSTES